jgi:hypothetical protein
MSADTATLTLKPPPPVAGIFSSAVFLVVSSLCPNPKNFLNIPAIDGVFVCCFVAGKKTETKSPQKRKRWRTRGERERERERERDMGLSKILTEEGRRQKRVSSLGNENLSLQELAK